LNQRLEILVLGLLAGLFCAAPVPGDVGGCGQPTQTLDPGVFFATKKTIDCDRCRECDQTTQTCGRACDTSEPVPETFPEGCVPLVHDGEVCLRALLAASCDDYASYVDDRAPSAPTECNFCPVRQQ
jgi:hypothetical protein